LTGKLEVVGDAPCRVTLCNLLGCINCGWNYYDWGLLLK